MYKGDNSTWYINDQRNKNSGFLKSSQQSEKIPSSGWQYFEGEITGLTNFRLLYLVSPFWIHSVESFVIEMEYGVTTYKIIKDLNMRRHKNS